MKKKEEEFKEKLIVYAKQFSVDVVYGSNKKCSIKEFDKITLPEDREKLIELMKKKGIWDDFNMLNYMKFNSSVIKGDVDEDLKKMIEVVKSWRLSLSRRKDVE